MKKVLLKDIVIPAGTIFGEAALKVAREPGTALECSIGLTKDTLGHFTYEVHGSLGEWFADA